MIKKLHKNDLTFGRVLHTSMHFAAVTDVGHRTEPTGTVGVTDITNFTKL